MAIVWLGKRLRWRSFLISLMNMSVGEKNANILTSLGVLAKCDAAAAQRQRGEGERKRFEYYLSIIGHVCIRSFAACYDISTAYPHAIPQARQRRLHLRPTPR